MLFSVPLPANSVNQLASESVEDLERTNLEYSDESKRFYEVSRDFSKQYAHMYSARLQWFREVLTAASVKRWPGANVLKLCELRDKHKECVLVGTLFKLQELKPSILKEISDQLEIIPQPPRSHFVHDSDSVVLEDELQRIRLVGDCVDVHRVVTGVVCALLGSEEEDGIFSVQEVLWPGCGIQKTLPALSDDRYILLMSGLNLASKTADHWFSLHLLLEWLAGLCGPRHYQQEVAKIARVIVAGGMFTNYRSEALLSETEVRSAAGVVDELCAAAAAAVPLDLMPACKEPTGVMLPQKPFHYCLFPKSVDYKSFNRVSNPYECNIGGFRCLGTSGEPIRDIMRYSTIDNALDAMKATLEWRHLAPTAPDTVPCAPVIQSDPFTIFDCPAVYFSGNCDKFATTLYEGGEGQKVRIVCVPDFCSSKTVAVVNLRTLDCQSMSFS